MEVNAETIFSLCESDMSNGLSVMCPAPPTSPVLRLESMDIHGIDVTWTIPQQYGDAQISVCHSWFFWQMVHCCLCHAFEYNMLRMHATRHILYAFRVFALFVCVFG